MKPHSLHPPWPRRAAGGGGLWVLRWVLGDRAKGLPSPAAWRRGPKFKAGASRWEGCGPAPKPQHLLSALVWCYKPQNNRGAIAQPEGSWLAIIKLHQSLWPEPPNTPDLVSAGLGLLEGADGERKCVIYRANNNQSATPASLQMLRADISSRSPITADVNDHHPPHHKPLKQLSGIKSVYCMVPAPFIQGSSSALQTIR